MSDPTHPALIFTQPAYLPSPISPVNAGYGSASLECNISPLAVSSHSCDEQTQQDGLETTARVLFANTPERVLPAVVIPVATMEVDTDKDTSVSNEASSMKYSDHCEEEPSSVSQSMKFTTPIHTPHRASTHLITDPIQSLQNAIKPTSVETSTTPNTYIQGSKTTVSDMFYYPDALTLLAESAIAHAENRDPQPGIVPTHYVQVDIEAPNAPLKFPITTIHTSTSTNDPSTYPAITSDGTSGGVSGGSMTPLRHGISRYAPYGTRFAATMQDGTVRVSHISGDLANRARTRNDRGARVDLDLIAHEGEMEQLRRTWTFCQLCLVDSGVRPGPSDVLAYLRRIGIDGDYRKGGDFKLLQRNASNFFKRMVEYGRRVMAGETFGCDNSGSNSSTSSSGGVEDVSMVDSCEPRIRMSDRVENGGTAFIPKYSNYDGVMAILDAASSIAKHDANVAIGSASSARWNSGISGGVPPRASTICRNTTTSTGVTADAHLDSDSGESEFDWGVEDEEIDIDDSDKDYFDKKPRASTAARRSAPSATGGKCSTYKRTSTKQASCTSLMTSGSTVVEPSSLANNPTDTVTGVPLSENSSETTTGTSLAMRSLYSKGLSRHSPYGTRFSAQMENGVFRESFLAGDLVDRVRTRGSRSRGELNLVLHRGEVEQLEAGWSFMHACNVTGKPVPGAAALLEHLRLSDLDYNHRKNGGKLLQKNAGNLFKRVQEFGRRRMADPYYLSLGAANASSYDNPTSTFVRGELSQNTGEVDTKLSSAM
ncbi:hypothetical protein BASA60_009383 [Batrachochytrium salamandrivorans]|nr:hypothetical protein BASA60_009383 [Batrachochytrium salamandrivorans]KAH9256544.1 hypothetical protein BASA81_005233 [Batrachochytrium salamandrivorans]